jgi:hypothetical protein
VGYGYFGATQLKLGVLTVKDQVGVVGPGHVRDRETVAVTVAKHNVNVALEFATHYP